MGWVRNRPRALQHHAWCPSTHAIIATHARQSWGQGVLETWPEVYAETAFVYAMQAGSQHNTQQGTWHKDQWALSCACTLTEGLLVVIPVWGHQALTYLDPSCDSLFPVLFTCPSKHHGGHSLMELN